MLDYKKLRKSTDILISQITKEKWDNWSLLDDFRNEVFCRRESNQHKADVLWKQIEPNIDPQKASLFKTEWAHYIMGEFDQEMFGHYFKKYLVD